MAPGSPSATSNTTSGSPIQVRRSCDTALVFGRAEAIGGDEERRRRNRDCRWRGVVHRLVVDIPNIVLWLHTSHSSYAGNMSHFEILLAGDRTGEPVHHVVIADAYAQEGPLTTFFNCESTHVRLDSWAERLASFRSSEIRSIRRVEESAAQPQPSLGLVG